jgi:signal transduction histidine kinase
MSLRTVLVLTLMLAIILAGVLAYFEQTERVRREHEALISGDIDRLAKLSALAMREPLWQFVPEQAESIIEAAFVNPDVLLIEVNDDKGRPFAQRWRDGYTNLELGADVVERTLPVERDGLGLGKLRVVMSVSGYGQKLASARGQYWRTAAIILAASVVIFLLVLQWGLVRPVRRLVESSLQLAKGDLRHPIEAGSFTELGQLSGSLEQTRQALLKLFSELEARNQALADANENLELRVAERTQSLEEAMEALRRTQEEMLQSEKLASLGRVVAGVAHELNTPIGNALTVSTTVASHLEVLQRELAEGALRRSSLTDFIDNTRDGIAIFVRNIERAAQLISNFKQVAIDHVTDQRRVFDLAEVTQEVLSTVEPAVRRGGCHVQTHLVQGLSCDGFPGAYGQVLTNLVMNVLLHAYPQGQGGEIEVSIFETAQPGEVGLSVRDHGVGMTEQVKRQVFDPFFTTRFGMGGSGLGMHIVHTLVTRTLQGSIAIQSEPGAGCNISICFPRMLDLSATTVQSQ